VVTKLDRLARSLPDARDILDELTKRNVKLSLGGSIHDPTDPVGRLLFNVLAMVAEFEADLIRLRTREGMKIARAKGRLRGKQPTSPRLRRPQPRLLQPFEVEVSPRIDQGTAEQLLDRELSHAFIIHPRKQQGGHTRRVPQAGPAIGGVCVSRRLSGLRRLTSEYAAKS
jgi:DNA invertase Pin-like site-specific DNA recombinase